MDRPGGQWVRNLVFATACISAGEAMGDDAGGHLLTVRLAPGASWRQEVVFTSNTDPLDAEASQTVTTVYRNTARPQKGGYRIMRQVENQTVARTGGDPELARILDNVGDGYRGKMEATVRRIDYRADAALLPQAVVNWPDIARKQQALTKEMFGGLVGEEARQLIAEQDPLAELLSVETLTALLRRAPMVPGEAQHAPGIIGGPEGARLDATHVITLVEWNAASDAAHYTVVTEPTDQARAEGLKTYYLELLYPLNTMDDAQVIEYQNSATMLAERSTLRDIRTCRFTATISSGLVSEGTCEWDLKIDSPVGGKTAASTLIVRQKLF